MDQSVIGLFTLIPTFLGENVDALQDSFMKISVFALKTSAGWVKESARASVNVLVSG